MHWFDDMALVRQLPRAFRAYAGYMRRAVDRRSGVVRGGSFLHRMLARLILLRGWERVAGLAVNGLVVHVDLCDPRMFWVLGEVRGDTAEADVIARLLKPGDTFVDVGANHGSYSLLAARTVGPTGAVFAFEPQPLLAELIRRSFEANRFSQATVEQVGCSDHAGTASFFVPRSNSGAAGIYPMISGARGSATLEVRLDRLDELLRGRAAPGGMVIKVDVEGAELVALRGARALLSGRRPPLLLEISPETSAAAGHRVSDVLDLLTELGYAEYAEIATFPDRRPLRSLAPAPQRNVVVLPG